MHFWVLDMIQAYIWVFLLRIPGGGRRRVGASSGAVTAAADLGCWNAGDVGSERIGEGREI